MRLSALVVMSLSGTVACAGEDAGSGAPVDPVAVAGATDQGLRIRLEPLDGRRVRFDVEADCEDGERDPIARGDDIRPLAGDHELEAPVSENGSFQLEDSYVVASTDGVTGDVEVYIEGRFTSDGTATGTLNARQVWHDPQPDEHFGQCSTGAIGWRADELSAVAPGEPVEIPLDGLVTFLLGGPDLLAIVESSEASDDGPPEVVIIDGRNEEVTGPHPLAASTDLHTVIDQAVMASVPGGVWTVAGNDQATLVRTDVRSGQPDTSVETSGTLALVGGDDALWALSKGSGPGSDVLLEKRDPQSGQVLESVPSTWGALAVGGSGLWLVDGDEDGSTVTRIDPETLGTIDSFPVDVPLLGSADVLATAADVWMLAGGRGPVTVLDAATGDVTLVDLPSYGASLAVDDEGAWITHPREDVLRRIESGEITRTVDVPESLINRFDLRNVAVTDDGTIWLADEDQVVRLDPTTLGG